MARRLSEQLTRKEMIDPQLEKAGWYLRDPSRVKIEIPVDGYDAEPWNGEIDYSNMLGIQFELLLLIINNSYQNCFLRVVQSVFLCKRHLETADTSTGSVRCLYEPPLDMFGADRWNGGLQRRSKEIVEFTSHLAI